MKSKQTSRALSYLHKQVKTGGSANMEIVEEGIKLFFVM
jgi:hypothetical protein